MVDNNTTATLALANSAMLWCRQQVTAGSRVGQDHKWQAANQANGEKLTNHCHFIGRPQWARAPSINGHIWENQLELGLCWLTWVLSAPSPSEEIGLNPSRVTVV